ncbi:MAG: MMPL family transporter [Alphaproteobacteria bacterium]|nr:MMPL family transporter [Alphaproteobacteria bacterium]
MSQQTDSYGECILKYRVLILSLITALTLLGAAGAQFLYFDNDYRVFFGKENPQLKAFEKIQQTYTKIDNVNFAVQPVSGKANAPEVLLAVEELTEIAWQLPFSIRVDSLSNYQHTEVDGDDLIVRDLYFDANSMNADEQALVDSISTSEPALAGKIHDKQHRATSVNATIQMPGKSADEVSIVAAAAREMAAEIEAKHNVKIRLGGVIFLNNAFLESSMQDMATLVPAMYIVILIVAYLLLRSVMATVLVLFVVVPSILVAMGIGGWMGIGLTPPSASAPTIITTLAVADSIHLLVSMFNRMRAGHSQRDSLLYSIRVNGKPIFLTSLTTALGFLSMNFSDSPPFHDLGNITAVGVMAAWIYSIVLLPILISFVPLKSKATLAKLDDKMGKLGVYVASRYKSVLTISIIISVGVLSLIPLNEINDDFVKYFDESVQYRQDTDWISKNLTGANQVQFSLPSGESNGVSDPAFIKKVSDFTAWAHNEPVVTHVQSISDTFKRLNRDLNAGDQAYYQVPETRELAAQYLLLYELSLPFGLDLNNQLDINKSSTQVIVTIDDMTTNELREWITRAETYLANELDLNLTAVGPTVMFAYISERNIKSMLFGTLVAVFLISGVILIALRDVRLGIISLIPNLLPAALAFGLWGLFVGQVNMAVAVVAGMALGVVVDDSVHFLSKYQIARRELKLSANDAVISAFNGVGTALVVTTLILTAGFAILAQSTFGVNSYMAMLTGIALVIALIADMTLLPALLIALDKDKTETKSASATAKINTKQAPQNT